MIKKDTDKAIEILKTLNKKELQGFTKERAEFLIKEWIKAEYHFFKSCGWDNDKITQDLNKYYLDKDNLISRLKTFNRVKEAILKNRLILRAINKQCTLISVEYLDIAKGEPKLNNLSLTTLKTLNCYSVNYNERAYKINAYGTSRKLEILLSMGYRLGLNSEEITQNNLNN